MGGEDDGGAIGHLIEFVDEHRALALQVGHNVCVVHDLPADVDRARVALKGKLDDVDRTFDARAKGSRRGQQHLLLG